MKVPVEDSGTAADEWRSRVQQTLSMSSELCAPGTPECRDTGKGWPETGHKGTPRRQLVSILSGEQIGLTSWDPTKKYRIMGREEEWLVGEGFLEPEGWVFYELILEILFTYRYGNEFTHPEVTKEGRDS